MCSSKDIRDATKADLSSDTLELADNMEHKDITPETEKGPSTLSPTGSSQPIETASSDLTSSRGSCEDIKAAEEADLSSVPLEDVTPEGVMEDNIDSSPGPSLDVSAAMPADLGSATMELVDAEDKDVPPEEQEDAVSKPSTTSSSPPAEHLGERSSVTDKDLAMHRESTPGPSGQDRNFEGSQDDNGAAVVAQITGLKKIFYNIIKEFFDSLTEEQRREISEDVWNLEMRDRLADMFVELLKLVVETITDVLSQAMYQSAPPYSTKSPDNISQSLIGSLGKAFCDVVGADTSISIPPKFTEAVVRAITDEVKSVLSETAQVSLDGGSSNVHQTIKVHKKTSWWWSCLCKGRKNKVHPISSSKLSSGHKNSSSPRTTSSSMRSSKLNSTHLELVDNEEDEDAPSEETRNIPSSFSIGWFPPACLEDEVPDYRESSLMFETQTEMRSSSCYQSGDSADRRCQTNVEEVCQIYNKGKKKDSTQHQAVRTKGPSLFKRFWLFCSKLSCCCCCCHNDD